MDMSANDANFDPSSNCFEFKGRVRSVASHTGNLQQRIVRMSHLYDFQGSLYPGNYVYLCMRQHKLALMSRQLDMYEKTVEFFAKSLYGNAIL